MSAHHLSCGHASSRRRSELRFAGVVSAGMIATVLTLAALLAPILAWHGAPGPNARDRSQTIRLSAPTPRAPAASFAIGLPGRTLAGVPPVSSRTLAAAGPALLIGRRLAVSERPTRITGPQRAAPPANSSGDTDGDGLPDVWELRYGLNPNNAADAAKDSDGDGLDNLTELHIRTAPNGTDTNGNGIADGDEDADADGLRNLVEQEAGTDPGSRTEVPPVPSSDEPTPTVIEDDPGVVTDDGSSGEAPDPPAPGQGGDAPPAPAPEHPLPPADTGGDAPPAPTPEHPLPPADTTDVPPPAPVVQIAPPVDPAPVPTATTTAPAAASPAPAGAPGAWHQDRRVHGSRVFSR